MRRQIILTRAIRVGIVAVAPNDKLLSNVGPAAWEASGALQVEQSLPDDAFHVVRPLVVHGGKQAEVEKILKDWCDAPNRDARCDLILTIGGDGLAPRDIMPDATRTVIERAIPGLAEMLRHGCPEIRRDGTEPPGLIPVTLSRAIAGSRRQTLIINIPASYARPSEAMRVILPILPEAIMSMGVDAFETTLTTPPAKTETPSPSNQPSDPTTPILAL